MLAHISPPHRDSARTGSSRHGLSSLFSIFSSRPAPAPQTPVTSLTPTGPVDRDFGSTTSYLNVLEVSVGSNLVKLTLSETGIRTERTDSRGWPIVVEYNLTKVEWFAVDDNTTEIVILYHDVQHDDKFQVSFRSPEYRTIWDTFCVYINRKGERLQHKRSSTLDDDELTFPTPSPGSPTMTIMPCPSSPSPAASPSLPRPLYSPSPLPASTSRSASSPYMERSKIPAVFFSSPELKSGPASSVQLSKRDEEAIPVLPSPGGGRRRQGRTSPTSPSSLSSSSAHHNNVNDQACPSTRGGAAASPPSAPAFDLINW